MMFMLLGGSSKRGKKIKVEHWNETKEWLLFHLANTNAAVTDKTKELGGG